MALISAVTNALTTVIGWIGTVIEALVGEAGQMAELLPVLAIGIAISVVFLGLKAIKAFSWGA